MNRPARTALSVLVLAVASVAAWGMAGPAALAAGASPGPRSSTSRIGMGLGQVLVPKGSVRGPISLTAGTVAVNGTVDGGVSVGAGQVIVLGTVTGGIHVGTGEILIARSAHVGGPLQVGLGTIRHESDRAVRQAHRSAVAGGTSVVVTSPVAWKSLFNTRLGGIVGILGGLSWGAGHLAARILWWAVSLGVALAVVAMFPEAAGRLEREIGAAPVTIGAWGLLVILAALPASVIMAVTLVGIPLAFALWVALLAAKVAGYAVVCALLGRRLYTLFGWGAATVGMGVLVGSVLLLLIGSIPVVGVLVDFVVACLGVGAAGRTGFGTGRPWFKSPPPGPMAAS